MEKNIGCLNVWYNNEGNLSILTPWCQMCASWWWEKQHLILHGHLEHKLWLRLWHHPRSLTPPTGTGIELANDQFTVVSFLLIQNNGEYNKSMDYHDFAPSAHFIFCNLNFPILVIFHETLGSEDGIYNLNLQMVSSGETLNRRKVYPFRPREFSRETQGLPTSYRSVSVQPAARPLNSLLFCCSDNTTQARPLTDRIVYLGLQFQKESSYWCGRHGNRWLEQEPEKSHLQSQTESKDRDRTESGSKL